MQAVQSQVVCDTCGRVTRNKYYGKKGARVEAGCSFAANSTYASVKCPFHEDPMVAETVYGFYWLPKCGQKGDPPPCSGCQCSPLCQCARAPQEQWRSSRTEKTVRPAGFVLGDGDTTYSSDNP